MADRDIRQYGFLHLIVYKVSNFRLCYCYLFVLRRGLSYSALAVLKRNLWIRLD